MSRLALKQEVSRDPLRAALADAISDLAAKREAREAVRVARDRADETVMASYPEIEAVDREIREARAAHHDEIAASVMRGDTKPGNTRRDEAEARRAEIEARTAAARDARDVLTDHLARCDNEVRMAESQVRERRDAILFTALPALTEAAADLRRQYESAAYLVRFVRGAQSAFLSANDPLRDIGWLAEKVVSPISITTAPDKPDASYQEWVAAAESLLSDPDAPLPGEPSPLSNAA